MMPDRDRAKEIILEILRQSGGALEGATRLYKAFYIAHLYYFDTSKGLLSDWPIVRLPHGPGPDTPEMLLDELIAQGKIKLGSTHTGPYPTRTYRLETEEPAALGEDEVESIASAWEFVHDKSAGDLSGITHIFSRSWREGQNGEELNIYTDLVEDDAYVAQMEATQRARAAWNASA